MSEVDVLREAAVSLDGDVKSLQEQRNELRAAENESMAKAREIGRQLRLKRAARVEIDRRIREAENPTPGVSPEVETIIQSVTATAANAAHAPPSGA